MSYVFRGSGVRYLKCYLYTLVNDTSKFERMKLDNLGLDSRKGG